MPPQPQPLAAARPMWPLYAAMAVLAALVALGLIESFSATMRIRYVTIGGTALVKILIVFAVALLWRMQRLVFYVLAGLLVLNLLGWAYVYHTNTLLAESVGMLVVFAATWVYYRKELN